MSTGFKIANLLLIESSFQRVEEVHFEEPTIERKIDVNVSVTIENTNVLVQVDLNYDQVFNTVSEVQCTIKYLGVFEYTGDEEIDLEKFGRTNGAAIIFPYIREYFTTLATKSGIGLIFIPPFAFLDTNKKEKKD